MEKKPKLSKKIKKGDKVIAIAGNHRGQTGTVLRRIDDKVVVQGLNIRKKHVKRSQANPRGGILELEMPIHISNLKPCTPEGEPVKLRTKVETDGSRSLIYQNGQEEVVYRQLKKS